MAFFGNYFAGGGGCDYPAAADVRSGVAYGFGAYAGTLAVPAEPYPVPGEHSPADVVRQLLVDLGLCSDPGAGFAWPAYASAEPPAPDEAVTVYDTAGTSFGRSMATGARSENPGVQVRVRARDHRTGWAKARQIARLLDTGTLWRAVTVGTAAYCVQDFGRTSDVLALGKEVPNSKRSLFTVNGTLCYRPL